ncbi:hypothetical protein MHC_04795 [Mycoplasma haemocanis str. Illinois]|uniref:Uncharacterized protein n=1 Tax=Mycoplasma haemocanis (strain Illinois) TaxID=1111676 RepID=H6N843_MYCHN|nr:hypothetical protein [Mycoplasma haemocanis]AEW45815.1 hypothetical protein MHC_04795 [Mycoplasma haemocanis str. Illinois]
MQSLILRVILEYYVFFLPFYIFEIYSFCKSLSFWIFSSKILKLYSNNEEVKVILEEGRNLSCGLVVSSFLSVLPFVSFLALVVSLVLKVNFCKSYKEIIPFISLENYQSLTEQR